MHCTEAQIRVGRPPVGDQQSQSTRRPSARPAADSSDPWRVSGCQRHAAASKAACTAYHSASAAQNKRQSSGPWPELFLSAVSPLNQRRAAPVEGPHTPHSTGAAAMQSRRGALRLCLVAAAALVLLKTVNGYIYMQPPGEAWGAASGRATTRACAQHASTPARPADDQSFMHRLLTAVEYQPPPRCDCPPTPDYAAFLPDVDFLSSLDTEWDCYPWVEDTERRTWKSDIVTGRCRANNRRIELSCVRRQWHWSEPCEGEPCF